MADDIEELVFIDRAAVQIKIDPDMRRDGIGFLEGLDIFRFEVYGVDEVVDIFKIA
jgi:hypothetical protein